MYKLHIPHAHRINKNKMITWSKEKKIIFKRSYFNKIILLSRDFTYNLILQSNNMYNNYNEE